VPLTAAAAVLIAAGSGVLAGGASSRAPEAVALPGAAAAPATAAAPVAAPRTSSRSTEAAADDAPDAEPVVDPVAEESPAAPSASGGDEAPPPTGDEVPPPTEDAPLGPESTAIGHVWVIALQGPDAAAAIAPVSGGGVTLERVTAPGRSALANGLALTAGLAPTPATDAGCAELVAGAVPDVASPCLQPAATPSIPGGLDLGRAPWRLYLDAVRIAPAADGTFTAPAGACGPAPADDAAGRALAARSPVAHLAGVASTCATSVRGLDALAADVADPATAPAYSYLALGGCAPAPGPAVPVADQLRDAVGTITASDAYQQAGLVVVTSVDATPAACGPSAVSAVPAAGAPAADAQARPTVVYSPWSPPGTTSDTAYGADAIARTTATALGVPAPGRAADPATPTFGTDVLGRAAPGAEAAETRAAARARAVITVPGR
jgi:hypothetical protein